MSLRVAVILPTCNAGPEFLNILDILCSQSQKCDVVIVDSSSDDDTLDVARQYKIDVIEVRRESFNHGGTRQMAMGRIKEIDVAVFLTQDALLADVNAIECILRPFHDKHVAAVCGRQLPRKSAALIEAHARLYNYSSESFARSINDVAEFGLKTAFISNSFAAYRISVLQEVGGFPDNVIFGEDMYVATKMLTSGYKIAYAADACVYHSHDYSLLQEMKRYFDMGVFHAREPWIRQVLGGAEGEGVKFVVSELKYLLKHAFWRIPEAGVRTILRYMGFRLGLMEKHLPLKLKRMLAMNKGYFKI
jgi:rhamnosyltransferase